jgi:hypothetical protein
MGRCAVGAFAGNPLSTMPFASPLTSTYLVDNILRYRIRLLLVMLRLITLLCRQAPGRRTDWCQSCEIRTYLSCIQWGASNLAFSCLDCGIVRQTCMEASAPYSSHLCKGSA